MGKLKKIRKYIAFRGHELVVSLKEFRKGSKLNKETYNSFNDSSILVSAHSVEKGMGLRNAEPGHSGKMVGSLLNKLIAMAKDSTHINEFPFRETLRVVISYMEYQERFDTSKFGMYEQLKSKYNRLLEILGNEYIDRLHHELGAGVMMLSKDKLLEGKEFDFMDFIRSRHSIRSFEKDLICYDDIRKAVEIANLAPSACNRQPSYVYFCNKVEKVREIDEMITGSSGFRGEVPNYIVVTTDRAYFSYVEQYQWYINGGLYLAYLSLALHSLGIGHCIMQWKAFYETEIALKKLLNISDTEAIIAIVGCGHYRNDTPCLMAQRKGIEDTLKIID
ncbi:MAG: nitroreductase family protein [Bacteroides sp.]|nr:nitroreductase family protein [Bacteroides sp.]